MVRIKMSTKINWMKPSTSSMKFDSLLVGDCFKIVSCEAVYMKIEIRHSPHNKDRFRMLELATGEVFNATNSCVEKVNVTINIYDDKHKDDYKKGVYLC